MLGVRTPSPMTIEVPRIVRMKSKIFAALLLSSFSLIFAALLRALDGVSNL